MWNAAITLGIALWMLWLTLFAEDREGEIVVTVIMKLIFFSAALFCIATLFNYWKTL